MNNQQIAKMVERTLQERVQGKPIHVEDATLKGDWSRCIVKNSRTEMQLGFFYTESLTEASVEKLVSVVQRVQA